MHILKQHILAICIIAFGTSACSEHTSNHHLYLIGNIKHDPQVIRNEAIDIRAYNDQDRSHPLQLFIAEQVGKRETPLIARVSTTDPKKHLRQHTYHHCNPLFIDKHFDADNQCKPRRDPQSLIKNIKFFALMPAKTPIQTQLGSAIIDYQFSYFSYLFDQNELEQTESLQKILSAIRETRPVLMSQYLYQAAKDLSDEDVRKLSYLRAAYFSQEKDPTNSMPGEIAFELGRLHQTMLPTHERAKLWLECACACNITKAHVALGHFYEALYEKEGVLPPDQCLCTFKCMGLAHIFSAINSYKHALEKNHLDAHYDLGCLYAKAPQFLEAIKQRGIILCRNYEGQSPQCEASNNQLHLYTKSIRNFEADAIEQSVKLFHNTNREDDAIALLKTLDVKDSFIANQRILKEREQQKANPKGFFSFLGF